MPANPKVCLEVDEITNQSQWMSVIASGRYQESPEPQYTAEREHARSLLGKRYRWWQNALGERQLRLGDDWITPLFFRIHIDSMTGLRAIGESAECGKASLNRHLQRGIGVRVQLLHKLTATMIVFLL